MLNIFNNLSHFIEDCYRRISVREYAKLIDVSPPTASKLLKKFESEKLLKKEQFKNILFFWSNMKGKMFVEISRSYWRQKLEDIGLIGYLETKLTNPTAVLFGSLSKAENKIDSDADIAVFGVKEKLDLIPFEKKLKRKIQLFVFGSLKDVKNKELANNILNGTLLLGRFKL